MKNILKIVCVVLAMIFALSFESCSRRSKAIEAYVNKSSSKKTNNIDIDLVGKNYNLISSITFEMLVNPGLFAGKRVRISGSFNTAVHEGRRYFSVFVWDPTGCCPAGLSFTPSEDVIYPFDFPNNNEKITVIGTMQYKDSNSKNSLEFIAEKIIYGND